FAILHSRFKEVLLLDADNVCVTNPASLFDSTEFQAEGAIFWPDVGRLRTSRLLWEACGLRYGDQPEFEAGQLLVDKERCWRALNLTMWLNEHSYFTYKYIWGDKETFQIAFRKLGQPFAMPGTQPLVLSGALCQHDFES